MVKAKKGAKGLSRHLNAKTMAIAGLIANIFIPGLGTLIMGKYDIGTIQLILSLIGFFLSITLIGSFVGIPLLIAMWIWAIAVSIKALKKAK